MGKEKARVREFENTERNRKIWFNNPRVEIVSFSTDATMTTAKIKYYPLEKGNEREIGTKEHNAKYHWAIPQIYNSH